MNSVHIVRMAAPIARHRSSFVPVIAAMALVSCGGSHGKSNPPPAGNSLPVITQVSTGVFSDGDNSYPTGSVIRIDVGESSPTTSIVSGTIRITSRSLGYDSGVQALTVGSIFFNWDTTNLDPAIDYRATITLVDSANNTVSDDSLTITLEPNPPAINKLVSAVDMHIPALGIPVSVTRTYLLDSSFDGSIGFGWTHSYLMHVTTSADGLVKLFDADGSGSFFAPLTGGGYASLKPDSRTLSKNVDGTLSLSESSGAVFEFDASGRLANISDRNGNRLSLDYDASGLLQTITDASGQVTIFGYDADDRVTSITDPAGRTVSYAYDASGNLVSTVSMGGLMTSYEYDSAHNLSAIIDPSGRATFFTVTADDKLESTFGEGGANKVTYEYGVPNPDQMTTMDALGNRTIFTFDNNSLVTGITDPRGNTESFAYDESSNLISVTDSNGATATRTYDALGNVLTTTDALGNTAVRTYEPLFSQLATLTNARGATTSFSYDANGNLTVATYPDGSTETFVYDAAGMPTSRTDRRGQTIGFSHDFRGLLTAKTFPDGSSDTFAYDTAGNLLSASDEDGTIAFSYDSADRLVEADYPGGEVVSYQYDASGNRSRITYPDGTVLDYDYDDANRLVGIGRGGKAVATYAYDALNQIVRRGLGNGGYSTRSYDPSGNLLDVVNSKPDGTLISSFSYTYDGVANRLTATTPMGTTTYAYDAIGQLTDVVPPSGSAINYQLDAAGNRSAVYRGGNSVGYTTNNLDQYTNVGGDGYTYDSNGNLTSKTTASGVTSYTYDFENQLIRIDTPTMTVSYSYDPLGRRSSETKPSGTTKFIFDGNRVIMEEDAANNVQATYVFGVEIDELLVMTRSSSDYYFMQDGLGSVADILDSVGDVVESFSYDPYGAPSQVSSVGNRYLFTGREFEVETGLYFYRSRYYDPELGRFTSQDPIGIARDDNLYAYVFNNPVNFVDPTGLQGSGPPGPNNCTLLRFKCETFYCNPHYILVVGWTDCLYCRADVKKRCGSTHRGDPSFVQACDAGGVGELPLILVSDDDDSDLRATIELPWEGSLVRADVPIFGLAYGRDFRRYSVQYGAGKEPTEWVTIAESDVPQTKAVTPEDLDVAGDMTLHGSLATWDTGLTNYVYLPSYPKDHPVDLNGSYTIRLVVEGSNGRSAEDRVTVDVGNVVSNAFGGKVTSRDGRFELHVPEQALNDAFRLMLAEPVPDGALPVPDGKRLIGRVYTVREPGEQFNKDAELRIAYEPSDLRTADPAELSVYAYDSGSREWLRQESWRHMGEDAVHASVPTLHGHYALLASATSADYSTMSAREGDAGARPVRQIAFDSFLVRNDFEDGPARWSSRDGDVGASVAIDDEATFDGSKALKITNRKAGGSFAVNVFDEPFDAREYPKVRFDYRITPGVKTDFLVKVSGRWYEIGFTDDPKELENQRVNIAHIGDIARVVADGDWHTAGFDLLEMLRSKTRNTRVDEIIMADWNVSGYMKLEFGSNDQGATYYIDNFTIGRDHQAGARYPDEVLMIDDFNRRKTTNALGGATETFEGPAGGTVEAAFVPLRDGDAGHALELRYDVSEDGSYAGYVSELGIADLRDYQLLRFRVRHEQPEFELLVGVRDAAGNESKLSLAGYLTQGADKDWETAQIPLAAFNEIVEWGRIENISLSFAAAAEPAHPTGVVLIDDIELDRRLTSIRIDDFDRPDGRNAIARAHWTYVGGAAAINGDYIKSADNRLYRLSYGGSIGSADDVSGEHKSFAGWATDLGGIDCSACEALTLDVRGASGQEDFTVYLDDGNFRWGWPLSTYATVSHDWQSVTIPLTQFADYGVDMSHLEKLELVFEGERMSGTVYLDDIRIH